MLRNNAATVLFVLSAVLAHDVQIVGRESTTQFDAQVEEANLRQALNNLAEAQLAAASVIRPRASEQDVRNAIGSTFRRLGVLGLYSVWGRFSPEGAARWIDAGDLLQVRTKVHSIHVPGSGTQPVSGGISRTYPVSGTFGAEQRDVYLLVLDAEQAGAGAARAGVRRSEIERELVAVIKRGLLRLGLVTDTASDEYKRWYWEGFVQRLGDGRRLTDTDIDKILRGHRSNSDWVLQPGMGLEISVGISTWEGDGVARVPENQALIRTVSPAYDKYKNIRVLLSDSFLLTGSGLEKLSSQVPGTVAGVEQALKRNLP
jgi:Xaa-Pro aminopeptidase